MVLYFSDGTHAVHMIVGAAILAVMAVTPQGEFLQNITPSWKWPASTVTLSISYGCSWCRLSICRYVSRPRTLGVILLLLFGCLLMEDPARCGSWNDQQIMNQQTRITNKQNNKEQNALTKRSRRPSITAKKSTARHHEYSWVLSCLDPSDRDRRGGCFSWTWALETSPPPGRLPHRHRKAGLFSGSSCT